MLFTTGTSSCCTYTKLWYSALLLIYFRGTAWPLFRCCSPRDNVLQKFLTATESGRIQYIHIGIRFLLLFCFCFDIDQQWNYATHLPTFVSIAVVNTSVNDLILKRPFKMPCPVRCLGYSTNLTMLMSTRLWVVRNWPECFRRPSSCQCLPVFCPV